MAPAWDVLKLLADPTRVRLLTLLHAEELSVAEIQEILGMGQSRISSHLGLLRQGGLVRDRRDGKRTYYSAARSATLPARRLVESALAAVAGDAALEKDAQSLARLIDRRRQVAEQYFDEVAARLRRNDCPGRSWEAVGHFFLSLAPRVVAADLGSGEGLLAHLLARRADKVYCVDRSARMVEAGTELARRHGIDNVEYRQGDIEDVPLEDASVDLAYLSQALHHARRPTTALAEAFRILRPGGRLAVLDLKEHGFEQARDLYADTWLGFRPLDLHGWLQEAGFAEVEVRTVAREGTDPAFETLLATAVKP